MSSRSRGCTNDPNIFCYICGEYVVKSQRQNITNFIKNVYYAYFGIKLGDQYKTWAPHKVCRSCVESLRRYSKGKQKSMSFGVPWCGESLKAAAMIATFVAVMFLGLT